MGNGVDRRLNFAHFSKCLIGRSENDARDLDCIRAQGTVKALRKVSTSCEPKSTHCTRGAPVTGSAVAEQEGERRAPTAPAGATRRRRKGAGPPPSPGV